MVLIDEIDLHLHPSWQRAVVPHLMQIFPNCQFIMTTHSPLILTDVAPEHIVILKEFTAIQNTQHTLGRDTNSILSDIMDVPERPKGVHKLFQSFL
ncbi:MAG: AAA family ATPase [Candidatus Parabeggiatoa sp.]|nr:AAA family ATPase [Candidatus Parabeggiatoa sp.]